jgi:purine-binding chemotaxis protein CheW
MGMMDRFEMTGTLASSEFLTFCLNGEEYGIDILKVQEIRGVENVTRIAGAPSHVMGVIDLRGVIVPIIDLQQMLNVCGETRNSFPVSIILNLRNSTVGVAVDSVSDVVALDSAQIRPVPEVANTIAPDFIAGLGSLGTGQEARMLILLDIEKLLGQSEPIL